MKAKKEKQAGEERIKLSGLLIGLALIFILFGVLLVILPNVTTLAITPLHICYVIAGVLVAFGIFLIVRYFLTESYKNLQQYGFSLGTMLVIVGMIALVRANQMSIYFLFTLGVLMLVASIFKLQNALDLKALSDRSWGFWLLIAIVFAVCAILVIMNPFPAETTHEAFTEWTLLIDGIVSLIGAIYLFFRVRAAKKQESLPSEEPQEEPVPALPEDDAPAPTVIEPPEDGEEEIAPQFADAEDFDAGIDDD